MENTFTKPNSLQKLVSRFHHAYKLNKVSRVVLDDNGNAKISDIRSVLDANSNLLPITEKFSSFTMEYGKAEDFFNFVENNRNIREELENYVDTNNNITVAQLGAFYRSLKTAEMTRQEKIDYFEESFQKLGLNIKIVTSNNHDGLTKQERKLKLALDREELRKQALAMFD